jgi:hypothetical protein
MEQHPGPHAEAPAVAAGDAETSVHLQEALVGEPFLTGDLAWPHLARLRTDPDATRGLAAPRLVIGALMWLPIDAHPCAASGALVESRPHSPES